jgi:hypothetical protein
MEQSFFTIIQTTKAFIHFLQYHAHVRMTSRRPLSSAIPSVRQGCQAPRVEGSLEGVWGVMVDCRADFFRGLSGAEAHFGLVFWGADKEDFALMRPAEGQSRRGPVCWPRRA